MARLKRQPRRDSAAGGQLSLWFAAAETAATPPAAIEPNPTVPAAAVPRISRQCRTPAIIYDEDAARFPPENRTHFVCPKCGRGFWVRPSRLKMGTVRYCSMECRKQSDTYHRPITYRVDGLGCHICTSRHTNDRYLRLHTHGRDIGLHAWAYERRYGPIPSGMVVRHKCDNPKCINPEHMELGTQLDNIRDREERGRTAKGTDMPNAKLDDEMVRLIRANNSRSTLSIAKELGLAWNTVAKARNGQSWKHVI